MIKRSEVQEALDAGGGLLRLEPSWVPRSFMVPGRRLKLHPDDLYALGGHRGGINERWFSSTTNADNGPGTPADEGLSYVRLPSGRGSCSRTRSIRPATCCSARTSWSARRAGTCSASSSTTSAPIPHHMHQSDEQARLLGRKRQARGVLLPAAVQRDVQRLPLHLHGPRAGHDEGRRAPVPRELEQRRQRHHLPVEGLSARAAAPAGRSIRGILHAPGSLVTYEPQVNSDVFAMYQSEVDGRIMPWDLLVKDVPPAAPPDLDYIIGMLDWDANVNPRFGADNRFFPKPVKPFAAGTDDGYRELWVCYGTAVVLGQGADRAAEADASRSRTPPPTASS